MSGMLAAHLTTACKEARASNAEVADTYSRWMRQSFAHDVEHLRKLYAIPSSDDLSVS